MRHSVPWGRQGRGFPCIFGCGFVDHAGRCVFTRPCGHCARTSQFCRGGSENSRMCNRAVIMSSECEDSRSPRMQSGDVKENPISTRTQEGSASGTRIISTDHQADERRTRNGGANDGRLNELVTKQTDVGDMDCEVTSSTAMKQSDGGGLHVQSCRWKTCAALSVSCNVLWSVVAVLRFGLAS